MSIRSKKKLFLANQIPDHYFLYAVFCSNPGDFEKGNIFNIYKVNMRER